MELEVTGDNVKDFLTSNLSRLMSYKIIHIDEIIEKVKDRFKFEDVPKDSAMEMPG